MKPKDNGQKSSSELLSQYKKQIDTIRREREEFMKKVSLSSEKEELKRVRESIKKA